MDTNGARHLQKRLEAHGHWCQAAAVADGRQPSSDPDVHQLEDIGDGVRLYGSEVRQATVHARPALVTFRMTKTLVDGAWERSVIEESVEYLDTHPATGRIEPRTA